jgi:hypothetical protein
MDKWIYRNRKKKDEASGYPTSMDSQLDNLCDFDISKW